ncbi:MAG TPA: flippase activity-associated protein Agl23 [Acidimicrobiales bacterium]
MPSPVPARRPRGPRAGEPAPLRSRSIADRPAPPVVEPTAPIEAPAAPEQPAAAAPTWWRWGLLAIVVVAGVARFVSLGARPMHHDESIDAWFSWQIAHGRPYHYDPVYHGPMRFYATAALFHLLGESETTARVLAASCGTAIVAVVGLTRRWLGTIGSLAAAAMVAVSPSMLYFSRFGREDTPMALLELGLLVVVMAWLTRPTKWHPVIAGALLAAAFAVKETSFIVVAVTGSFLVVVWLVDVRRGRRARRAGEPSADPAEPAGPASRSVLAGGLRTPGWRWWLLGAAAFALVFGAAFSVGFTHPGGIADGVTRGIRYWLSQQPVNRGAQPWPFYLVLLAGYEWPIVLLAVGGLVAAVRRFDPARTLVAWVAVANLAIYSWASERFPWLVIHPLLPLILLAGIAVQAIWDSRARFAARAHPVLALVGPLAIAALALLAQPVVYAHPNDPRELMVAVQTGPEVPRLRDRIARIEAAAPKGHPPRIVVDTQESITWPWAWYLRNFPVAYEDLHAHPETARGADIVIAATDDVAALAPPASGWRSELYDHRVFWLPTWSSATVGQWFDWITTRRTFSPPGATQAVELERRGLPGR